MMHDVPSTLITRCEVHPAFDLARSKSMAVPSHAPMLEFTTLDASSHSHQSGGQADMADKAGPRLVASLKF